MRYTPSTFGSCRSVPSGVNDRPDAPAHLSIRVARIPAAYLDVGRGCGLIDDVGCRENPLVGQQASTSDFRFPENRVE